MRKCASLVIISWISLVFSVEATFQVEAVPADSLISPSSLKSLFPFFGCLRLPLLVARRLPFAGSSRAIPSRCGFGPAGLEVAHFFTCCLYHTSLYPWVCPCASAYSLCSGRSPWSSTSFGFPYSRVAYFSSLTWGHALFAIGFWPSGRTNGCHQGGCSGGGGCHPQ